MPTKVKTGQIYLPTGYEGLQKQAESKRRVADALWQSGMQGTANPVSIVQVLGDLAQVWSGNRKHKQADQLEVEAANKMGQDFNGRFAEFTNDAKMLSPQALVAKWGNDPFMQEHLKPYMGVMEAGLKDDQSYTDFGGQWRRKGEIPVGSFKPNDPNSNVIRGQDGGWMLNPLAITGKIASQGIPVEQGTYRMQDPAMGGQMPAQQPVPMAPKSVAETGQNVFRVDQYQAAVQQLGPVAAVDFAKRNGFKIQVTTPQEAEGLPSGTPILLPDGTEGEVP